MEEGECRSGKKRGGGRPPFRSPRPAAAPAARREGGSRQQRRRASPGLAGGGGGGRRRRRRRGGSRQGGRAGAPLSAARAASPAQSLGPAAPSPLGGRLPSPLPFGGLGRRASGPCAPKGAGERGPLSPPPWRRSCWAPERGSRGPALLRGEPGWGRLAGLGVRKLQAEAASGVQLPLPPPGCGKGALVLGEGVVWGRLGGLKKIWPPPSLGPLPQLLVPFGLAWHLGGGL